MALPCTISMKLELRPIGMKDILTCKQLANPLNEKNLFDAEYKKEIRGGVIEIGADGTPTGFLSEQAQTYVRQFMDHESLYSLDMALSNLVDIEHHMLSEGYTMYHEGWGNYFVNTN